MARGFKRHQKKQMNALPQVYSKIGLEDFGFDISNNDHYEHLNAFSQPNVISFISTQTETKIENRGTEFRFYGDNSALAQKVLIAAYAYTRSNNLKHSLDEKQLYKLYEKAQSEPDFVLETTAKKHSGPQASVSISKYRHLIKLRGENDQHFLKIGATLDTHIGTDGDKKTPSKNIIVQGKTKDSVEKTLVVLAALAEKTAEIENHARTTILYDKKKMAQEHKLLLQAEEADKIGKIIDNCVGSVNAQIISEDAQKDEEKKKEAKALETRLYTLKRSVMNKKEEYRVKWIVESLQQFLAEVQDTSPRIDVRGIVGFLNVKIEELAEKERRHNAQQEENKKSLKEHFSLHEIHHIRQDIVDSYTYTKHPFPAEKENFLLDNTLTEIMAASLCPADVDLALENILPKKEVFVSNAVELSEDKYVGQSRISTPRMTIEFDNAHQEQYVNSIRSNEATVSLGPQGVKKSFLAVASMVEMILQGKVRKGILVRTPTKHALSLGLEPGTEQDKLKNHNRHLTAMITSLVGAENASRAIRSDDDEKPRDRKNPSKEGVDVRSMKFLPNDCIEIVDINKVAGMTLDDAYIIVDEAQDCTAQQLDDMITRKGKNSKLVLNGSYQQIHLQNLTASGRDVPEEYRSGLWRTISIMKLMDIKVGITEFTEDDCVRSDFVKSYITAKKQFEEQHPTITQKQASADKQHGFQMPTPQQMAIMMTMMQNMMPILPNGMPNPMFGQPPAHA